MTETKFLNGDYPAYGDLIGIYIAVFVIALPIIATVLDFFGVADQLMYKLGDQAHKNYINYMIKKRENIDDVEKGAKVVNCCGQLTCCVDQKESLKETNFDETVLQTNPIVIPATLFGYEKIIFGQKYENRIYDAKFLQSLVKSRAYYNCYSSDRAQYFYDFSIFWDGLFYCMNNHSVLATICCLPEHPISRQKWLLAFIVRHGFGFLVAIFFSEYSVLTAILLNVLFITPMSVFISFSFYVISVCPCFVGKKLKAHAERVWSVVIIIQTCILIFCILVSIFWFVLAGIITAWYWGCTGKTKCEQESLPLLTSYMYQVFIVGFFMEFIYVLLLFASSKFYFGIKVLSFPIIEISRWFAEYVEMEGIECKTNETYIFLNIIEVILLYDPLPKDKKCIDVDAIIPTNSDKQLKALFVTSQIITKMKNKDENNIEDDGTSIIKSEAHLKALLVAAKLYEYSKKKVQKTNFEPINEKAMEIAKQIRAMIVLRKWTKYVIDKRRLKNNTNDTSAVKSEDKNEASQVENEASEVEDVEIQVSEKKKKNKK